MTHLYKNIHAKYLFSVSISHCPISYTPRFHVSNSMHNYLARTASAVSFSSLNSNLTAPLNAKLWTNAIGSELLLKNIILAVANRVSSLVNRNSFDPIWATEKLTIRKTE